MRRLVLTALLAAAATPALAEYSFTLTNNSDQRIVEVEVSEDGRSWGTFDIGRGIASGDSVEMVWDESTDDSDCEWYFRATFSGGETSEPVPFDFCDDDLEVEFDFD